MAERPMPSDKKRSLRALEATNFFMADVQTGLGPFLAAYLAFAKWRAEDIGYALTIAGLVTVVLQTPAGAIVDSFRRKRLLLIGGVSVLTAGALLLVASTHPAAVYTAQVLIGASGPFLGPTLAAITMGLVGTALFDRQFGRNQGFNSAGNLAAAGGIALVSHFLGTRAIFWLAAALTLPTVVCIMAIRGKDIDNDLARGGCERAAKLGSQKQVLTVLFKDRALLAFLGCAFLFHFANAAMLPEIGEMLARGSAKAAAPFMAACVAVTQLVIMLAAAWVGRISNRIGRKPLLLLGYGVLPIRAVLYTVFAHTVPLIGVQFLDGVANAIFGVVSILVVSDLTKGTGRFNLVQGALATAVGIGAALSTTFGGKLIAMGGFKLSFYGLGAVAALAFVLLLFAVPETLHRSDSAKDTPAPALQGSLNLKLGPIDL